MNLFRKLSMTIAIAIVGATAYGAPELRPTPDPIASPPTKANVQTSCKVLTYADVYTITSLNECGQRLDNSGLGGVFNRARRCAAEAKLAEVFATPATCDSCATASKVAAMRCNRAADCRCENPDYVKALVLDLMDGSRRVRRASEKSLKVCGYRVAHDRACVEAEVPSAILY